MSLSLLRPAGQRGVGLRSRRFSSSCTWCSRRSLTHRSSNAAFSPVIRRRQEWSARTRCAGGGPEGGVDGKGVSGNGNTSSIEERQQLAEPVGEDDVSPLRNALKRAMERKEKAAEYRVSLEHEAQDVAQLAVRETELLAKAERKLGDANREVEQAEAQLASVRAKTDLLEKLLAEASEAAEPVSEGEKAAEEDDEGRETSAATRAEGGAGEEDAASSEKTAAAAAEKSAVAQELYTQLTACQEVRHTLVQKLLELRHTQAEREGSLAAVSERSLKAEKRASLVMQEAQNAFQDEMEAEAVVEQIRLAFQKASEQLEAMETRSKPKKPAPKKPEPAAAADADSSAAPSVTNGADSRLKEESKDAAAGAAKAAAAAAAKAAAAAAAATAAVAAAAAAPVAEKPSSEWVAAEAAGSKAGSSSGTLPARLVDPAVHLSVEAGKKLDYRLLAAVVAAGAAAALLLHLTGALSAVASALTDRISALPMAAEKVVAELLAGEEGLLETIALLFTSVLSVPLVLKFVPGGSAVLGFLLGGAVIGPHALGLIKDVEQIKHLAELGVVFLLFNIGLELSLERLQSLAKYVFGLGNLHFLFSLAGIAAFTLILSNVTGPGAIILGGALALSSTAVAMQVLADRGESGAKHGRATFAVLLLQDLVVVVMLMLVPLLASGGASVGLVTIVKALSVAGIKAALCIAAIIAGGRVVLRPIYRRISTLHNAEIFAATTLLLVLGTSVLTQLAGLSLALGAFLAGLSVAETEYALQVESDIAPFKGLLMGLFFMSVGMEISMGLLIAEFRTVALAVAVLLVGKTAVMAALGPAFGLSRLSSVRSGLYLAPGGEFAFVILGDAVSRGVLPAELVNVLFISVVLSMALTPYLAMFGSWLGKRFESKDMMALQPKEQETAGMRDHIVIAGFGRVGQVIAQVLSDNFIPYVAVDVRSDRVAAGKEADLPVYFGDAGSPGVLHAIGTRRAKCAVVTLDTPGGNYRTVWAISKNFPNVKIYCRAHDVDHGVNLEKAGATVVVPETLEPSLQLAAAILGAMNMSRTDVIDIVDSFRDNHMSELAMLSKRSGSSLGYGYDLEPVDESDTSDEEPESEERPDPEVDSIAGERGQLAPAT